MHLPAPTHFGTSVACALALMLGSSCGRDKKQSSKDSGDSKEQQVVVAPKLLSEPRIVTYPKQPMVVDVIVELDRSGSVSLVHDSDPGVVIERVSVEVAGRRHELRVRGLAPDTKHQLTLHVADVEEPEADATHPLSFTTEHALPGFRPSFEVEVSDAAAVEPVYRMFDYGYTPLWDPTAIFVVDAKGTTRWYYGNTPFVAGPTSVWAANTLLDDGGILTVRDGAVTILDELGHERIQYSALAYMLPPFHHEILMMDNGNFLTLSNSFKDVDYSSLGMSKQEHVAGDLLVELSPEGELVWTWDAFDHLDPLRVRSAAKDGLPYLNPLTGKKGFDWTHGNAMIQTAKDDVILLSMRHQDWIIAIDHKSGDILWRFGPEGDFELLEGTWFYHQHSPQWQADGTLLLYDNGVRNLDVPKREWRSRAVRYALDFEAMTARQVWDDIHGEAFVSAVGGDVDRMPGGHLLALDTALQPNPAIFDVGKNYSRLRELSDEDEPSTIWSLTTKVGSFLYRAVPITRLPGQAAE